MIIPMYVHVIKVRYSLTKTLKKLACELHAALHEPKNILCASVSAQEGDDISTALESKHTCYKLVTSLSTCPHNVNTLDMCHT